MESRLINYEAIIASLASELGYDPRLKTKSKQSERISAPRVAIITPSAVVEREGRKRQRLTSEVEFMLVCAAVPSLDTERVELTNQMRLDILEIIAGLESRDEVLEIEEVEITPLTEAVGLYSEVAVEVALTILSSFDGVASAEELL